MTPRQLALTGLLCLNLGAAYLSAQGPTNLLTNPGANEDLLGWRASGAASTETLAGWAAIASSCSAAGLVWSSA